MNPVLRKGLPLGTILALILAACGGNLGSTSPSASTAASIPLETPAPFPSGDVTVELWTKEGDPQINYVQSLADAYHDLHANVTVNVVNKDVEALREDMVNTALAPDTQPQLLWTVADHLGPFLQAGVIQPIGGKIDPSIYAPSAMDAMDASSVPCSSTSSWPSTLPASGGVSRKPNTLNLPFSHLCYKAAMKAALVLLLVSSPAFAWHVTKSTDPMTDATRCMVTSDDGKIAFYRNGTDAPNIITGSVYSQSGVTVRVDDREAIYIGNDGWSGPRNTATLMEQLKTGTRLRFQYRDYPHSVEGEAPVADLLALLDACP